MKLLERKGQFKSKVYELALNEEENTDKTYQECIDIAIGKAKSELGISESEYRKMFA